MEIGQNISSYQFQKHFVRLATHFMYFPLAAGTLTLLLSDSKREESLGHQFSSLFTGKLY